MQSKYQAVVKLHSTSHADCMRGTGSTEMQTLILIITGVQTKQSIIVLQPWRQPRTLIGLDTE
jgi:hypothetical protein